MPLVPIRVRFRMQSSTSLSIIPSTHETQWFSIASIDEKAADEIPVAILSEQLGLAPSQIIPVMLAIIFFTE